MIAVPHPSIEDVGRLQRALKHGNGQTLADVLDNINNGSYVLLRAPESTVTIMQGEDSIHINHMGGTRKDIPEILSSLVQIAKELGKQYITLEGRKGWSRILKPYGFEPIDKELRYTL